MRIQSPYRVSPSWCTRNGATTKPANIWATSPRQLAATLRATVRLVSTRRKYLVAKGKNHQSQDRTLARSASEGSQIPLPLGEGWVGGRSTAVHPHLTSPKGRGIGTLPHESVGSHWHVLEKPPWRCASRPPHRKTHEYVQQHQVARAEHGHPPQETHIEPNRRQRRFDHGQALINDDQR